MAVQYFYTALFYAKLYNNLTSIGQVYLRLTKYHIAQGNRDSALYYARKNLFNFQSMGPVLLSDYNGVVYDYLSQSYNLNHQFDSAFKYLRLALITNDSISSVRIKNLSEFQNLSFKEQLRLQDLEKEKIAYQNKIRTWFLLAGIGFLVILAIIFYRNDRQKHKAKLRTEEAYNSLKATQAQLIQSEKMASHLI